MSLLSYDERLSVLGLERLEIRRLRFDLTMCFTILHGLVDLHSDDFFTYSLATNTRGRCFKLNVPNSRINARQNFFCVRVVNIWNNLPDSIVNATSLDNFTCLLKRVDFKDYLLGKL